MNIRYSGKLTKNEYLANMKLSTRPILKKGGFHFDFWIVFTVIGAFFLLISVITVFQWSPSQSNSFSFPWYVLEFIVGVIFVGLGIKLRGLPSKYWEENKETLFDGKISDEDIEFYTPHGNLKVSWSEFSGYGEYQGLIVLYKNKAPLFVLPFTERFFEKQEEWLAFKKFVGHNLLVSHRVNQFSPIPPRSKLVYTLFLGSIIILLIYYFLKGG